MPWLLLLRACSLRAAFWWSYLIGFLFFFASMYWLIHVTVVGWIMLCLYLAIYFGVFGLIAAKVFLQPPASSLQPLVIIPAAWTALEFARSHLLSGLGWNLLAYSQTPWPVAIQLADITGVWGISFLIVVVNVAITSAAGSLRAQGKRRAKVRKTFAFLSLVMAVCCVAIALVYGVWRLRNAASSGSMRIAVVQGNIPQEEKWDEEHVPSIVARYEMLTKEAAAGKPQLIIWPETSVPGYFGVDEALTQRVLTLARSLQIPMLVGAPMLRLQSTQFLLSNSAALVDASGTIVNRYDKLHLVPFGEFIPFERPFPWLRRVLPPIGDFVAGHDVTVFTAAIRNSEFGLRNETSAIRNPQSAFRFSVLICFEDVFPELARQFVQKGARALVVITNDAWFGPSAAAYQHAQASIFRAVELRVPVIRAANTGWSGFIDAYGRSQDSVHDASGRELFVAGTQSYDVALGPAHSFYERWGDWFALGCILVPLGILVGCRYPKRVKRR